MIRKGHETSEQWPEKQDFAIFLPYRNWPFPATATPFDSRRQRPYHAGIGAI
jgi:hypothetical protein